MSSTPISSLGEPNPVRCKALVHHLVPTPTSVLRNSQAAHLPGMLKTNRPDGTTKCSSLCWGSHSPGVTTLCRACTTHHSTQSWGSLHDLVFWGIDTVHSHLHPGRHPGYALQAGIHLCLALRQPLLDAWHMPEAAVRHIQHMHAYEGADLSQSCLAYMGKFCQCITYQPEVFLWQLHFS